MTYYKLFTVIAIVAGSLSMAGSAFAQVCPTGAPAGPDPVVTSGHPDEHVDSESDLTTDRELDMRHREYDTGPNTGMLLDPSFGQSGVPGASDRDNAADEGLHGNRADQGVRYAPEVNRGMP